MGRSRKVSRYLAARKKWHDAGKPVRSDAEVFEILESKCKPCPHYKRKSADRGRCGKCGCLLNLGKRLNKLYWATESCPDNPPRWGPDMGKRETKEERTERIKRRNERIAKRNARTAEEKARDALRIARRNADRSVLGRPAKVIVPTESKDPLRVFDRHGKLTTSIRDHWRMSKTAFLVCGGNSLRKHDLSLLADPLVCSMGVNNVAAYAPVKAMVHSDPVSKFHGAIWQNPGIMKFTPEPKLKEQVRFKDTSGFYFSPYRAMDFPNVWAYERNTYLYVDDFLQSEVAYWGVNPDKWPDMKGRRGVLFTPFVAIRLLYYLGIRVIYLLGVDLIMGTGNDGYAFGQSRSRDNAATNNLQYRIANDLLVELRPHFEDHGLHVFNCNPTSRCSAFDHVDYESAIASVHAAHPARPLDLDHWYEKGDELRRVLNGVDHGGLGGKVLGKD